jgi:YqaJ-like viral recombinase domain
MEGEFLMVVLNFPQGSIEWITARLWRLTASNMSGVITATGALSASILAEDHIDKLIAGIELANVLEAKADDLAEYDDWKLKTFMSNYNGDKFSGSSHTRRGHDCEPDAIAAMSELLGTQITDVGMCVMGDETNGVVSCSPDGLIYEGGTLVAGAEVKSPSLAKYIGHVRRGILPADYRLQAHASMAICQVDTWHFGSYFVGKPLFHIPVKRGKYTDTIAESLENFRATYEVQFHDYTEKAKLLIDKTKFHGIE